MEFDLADEEFEIPDFGGQVITDPVRNDRLSSLAALASSSSTDSNTFAFEYEELKANFEDIFVQQGEDSVRNQMDVILRNKLENQFEQYAIDSLQDIQTDEQIKQENVLGALAAIEGTRQSRKYALEELAIDRVKELSLNDQSQLEREEHILNDRVAAEVDDTIREYVRRSLILASKYEEIAQEHEDQEVIFDVLDFFGRWIPTNTLTASSNIIDDVNTSFSVRAGDNIAELTESLYSLKLSPEEFDEKIEEVIPNLREQSGFIGENKAILAELMAAVAAGAPSGAVQRLNAETVGDILLSMPLGSIARRSSALAARLLGNRKLAQEVSVNDLMKDMGKSPAIEDGTAPHKTKAAIEEALPSEAKTEVGTVNELNPGVAGTIRDAMNEIRQATLNITQQLGSLGRLEAPELAEMIEKEVKRIKESYGKRVLPIDILPSREQGIHFVNMAIGKADGSLFKNAFEAEKQANKMGFKGFEIVDGNGGAYIKVKHNMDESPYYKAWDESEVKTKVPFLHFLRSPDGFNPEVITDMAAQASFNKSKLYGDFRTIQKKYSSLPKKERQRVDDISVSGNYKNKWYTEVEFIDEYMAAYKELPKAREVIAYMAQKEIHDMNWGILNWAERTKLVSSGWKAINIDGTAMGLANAIVKPVETMKDFRNTIIYKTGDDSVLYGENLSEAGLKQMMDDEGLKLYKMYDDAETPSGVPFNYIMAKEGDVRPGELTNVVPYRAGGPRAYEGNFFIKQFTTKGANIPKPDGTTLSRRVVVNPTTLMVGRSRTELKEAAENLEKARKLHNEKKLTDADVDALTPWSTVKQWNRAIKNGEINVNHPFTIVKGNESPAPKGQVLDADGSYVIATDSVGPNMSREASGRLLMSRRGKPLYDAQHGKANIIRPSELIQQVSENLLHTASFTDFKISAINRWAKTYAPYMEDAGRLSPEQMFWRGELKTNGNPEAIINQATATREAIKRILNAGSSDSRLWQVATTRLADWVDGRGYGELSSKILNVQSKDPINAMKGMAFDLKLGFFDPSQLIIQTQTIAAMASLRDPVTAAKFGWQGSLLRMAHINQTQEMASYLAKKSNMDVAEFKEMVDRMRKGGYLDINGEHILTDHHSAAVYGLVGGAIRKVRDMGRFPFYEAERWNRAYGYRMAWDDLTKKYGTKAERDKAFETGDAQRFLSGKTNDYTMNMLGSSAAAYQKGVFAVPTQFMAYQLRMLENILPEVFGGSTRFTTAQKVRLGVGQLLLYGSAGIPFGRYLAESTMEATGAEFDESMTDQTLHRLIAGGVTDSFIYAITAGKADLAFSDRAAVGKGIEQVISDIFGLGPQQKSMAEIIFGAMTSVGGQVLSDAFESVQYAALAATTEQVGTAEVTPLILKSIGENFSTASRMMKAYYVWRYNVFASQETGKALTFASGVESVAAALGIPLREVADLDVISYKINNRSAFLKDNGTPVLRLRMEALRALANGDMDKYHANLDVSAALLQVHDMEDRYAILDWVNNQASSRTVVQGYRDRFMKKFPSGQLMKIEED